MASTAAVSAASATPSLRTLPQPSLRPLPLPSLQPLPRPSLRPLPWPSLRPLPRSSLWPCRGRLCGLCRGRLCGLRHGRLMRPLPWLSLPGCRPGRLGPAFGLKTTGRTAKLLLTTIAHSFFYVLCFILLFVSSKMNYSFTLSLGLNK